MTLIEDIVIRKILDSRGNPTVEVEVFTTNGYGTAAAPSGASTGIHEVKAFPEAGVDSAIEKFYEKVQPDILGMDVLYQTEIDNLLNEIDGTENFAEIGGNVAVATSLAVAKAAAGVLGLPLYSYVGGAFAKCTPRPLGNVLGGGSHAVGGTTIQEFMAISLGPTATDSIFSNALAHKTVGKKLKQKLPDAAIGKGDEGAWVAALDDEAALELVVNACSEVSDEVGFEVAPALDVAASEFFSDGKYHYKGRSLTPGEQIDFMAELVDKYGLHFLEDPLDQNDFKGYRELTEKVGDKCLVCGDDLFVTDRRRIEKGVHMGAANSVLIKPNQIGTLTRTYDAVRYAHENGYRTIISHRSGETTDETIAHLAVAFGCYAIKTGAVGGERIAKLNELIRIEEDLCTE